MTLTTFSTCSETTRDRLKEARQEVRDEHGHAPREVAALDLTNENLSADKIDAAITAVQAAQGDDWEGTYDNLANALSDALFEVTRRPAPGGKSKAPTFPVLASLAFAILAMMLPASASAATPSCVTVGATTAKVDKYNVLTTHTSAKLAGDKDQTITATIDTYRDGQLEYRDVVRDYLAPGPVNVDTMEQLPITWKSTRLRIRTTVKTACGSATTWTSLTTPARPRP